MATTTVNERNGWINLSASNFEFSAPKIQVKLTQQPVSVVAPATNTATPPKLATKTISCVKGKTLKKVTAVKPFCPVGYVKK